MNLIFNKLKKIQSKFGFLPETELQELSELISVPLYKIHRVASFYPHFKLHPPPKSEIYVCQDLSCHIGGACSVIEKLNEEAAQEKDVETKITPISCVGRCDGAPVVGLGDKFIAGIKPVKRGKLLSKIQGDPFSRTQRTSVFQSENLDPYPNGMHWYSTFLNLTNDFKPLEIIGVLKESSFKGMGGAGFPVGLKWEFVRKAQSASNSYFDPEPDVSKYVICNADESEPGTFKDRLILQNAGHLVIEGMMIAMEVVGAEKGIIFIRHEYSSEREILEKELKRIKSNIEIFESPGGYICGEETALLEALENRRSEPRNKPPFPGVQGLFQKPTLINNVETFAWIPSIIKNGPQWWKSKGKNGAVGSKFFALNGDVRKPGVYETSLGIRVSELISEFGNGVARGKRLKAFLPGGASSGFLPGSMAEIPLDFRSLSEMGSMLGSGAVVAISENRCILDLAINLTRFFRNESCGKCVPCRIGTHKLAEILENFKKGKGAVEDFSIIEKLDETLRLTSICGLGQVAALPAVSALKYFKDEISDHFRGKTCPEGICFKE